MTGDTNPDSEEERPLSLSDLSGATLVWEDADGTEHEVHFDE